MLNMKAYGNSKDDGIKVGTEAIAARYELAHAPPSASDTFRFLLFDDDGPNGDSDANLRLYNLLGEAKQEGSHFI